MIVNKKSCLLEKNKNHKITVKCVKGIGVSYTEYCFKGALICFDQKSFEVCLVEHFSALLKHWSCTLWACPPNPSPTLQSPPPHTSADIITNSIIPSFLP